MILGSRTAAPSSDEPVMKMPLLSFFEGRVFLIMSVFKVEVEKNSIVKKESNVSFRVASLRIVPHLSLFPRLSS